MVIGLWQSQSWWCLRAARPAYPQERLAFMLEDAQVSVLLTQAQLVELPQHGRSCAHRLENVSAASAHIAQSQENPISGVIAENLAYVIYTSGSTGKPKGATNTEDSATVALDAGRLWINSSRQCFTEDALQL